MMKNSKNLIAVFSFILVTITSCTLNRASEDKDDGRSEDPTISVISPDDGDLFYTSEGPNRQADFHFIGRDDVTIDYVEITVLNSNGDEVHNDKKIMRQTTLEFEMFRNFSITTADTYTVIYEVADTANNIVEARRTIIFEDRIDSDTDALLNK